MTRASNGDGIALWFAERPGLLGHVYGSADLWNGLAIVIDTYNNDGVGPNPLISAVLNDGTLHYDAFSDGQSQAIATCSMDVRRMDPVSMRVRYFNQRLSVEFSLQPSSSGDPQYQLCFAIADVELGVDKFFGISASTGDAVDNHDIVAFTVTDFTSVHTNIDQVRTSYKEHLSILQELPDHAPTLDISEFQHSVLTTLGQLQEGLQMVEQGNIAISEMVTKLLFDDQDAPAASLSGESSKFLSELITSVGPRFDGLSKQIDRVQSSLPLQQPQQQQSQAATGLGSTTDAVLSKLRDSLENVRTTVEAVRTSVDRVERAVPKPTPPAPVMQCPTSVSLSWPSFLLLSFNAIGVMMLLVQNVRRSRSNLYKLP